MYSRCNLCGWPIVILNNSAFGARCIKCRSTQIHRAIGSVFCEIINDNGRNFVYELSSRGAFFSYLKNRFPNLYYSEYYDNYPVGLLYKNIPCQDVQNLLLLNGTFDVVTSTEVFEHVPDDRRGFAEVYRVLKKGGYFIFTVPLAMSQDETIERASLGLDGKITHHLPPGYHGDRIRGRGAVLAFRNYGVDILERLNDVGFESKVITVNKFANSIVDQPVVLARK